jgi:ketosteroid isomerase-like protein
MIRTQQPSTMSVRAAVSVIGLVVMLISTSAPAAESDKAAVLAANGQFYVALNKMFIGDVDPIKAIWSHGDDVTYMGPTGGFEHGWSAVLKNWEGQAALKLGGRVEPVDMQVVVGQDVAVVSDYEQGENTNANGKIERLRLRATNIFRKEDGQWKMVGHHTDPLPYLTK